MTGTKRFDDATGGNVAVVGAVSSIIIKVCTALLIAAVLGGAGMFIAHGEAIAAAENRLNLIEATRYTSTDAQDDRSGLMATLTQMQVTLASMNERLKGLEAAIKDKHR